MTTITVKIDNLPAVQQALAEANAEIERLTAQLAESNTLTTALWLLCARTVSIARCGMVTMAGGIRAIRRGKQTETKRPPTGGSCRR